jgi:hypothetical protein
MTWLALLIPRAIVRLTFGPYHPDDEPSIIAWFATILEEISEFGGQR